MTVPSYAMLRPHYTKLWAQLIPSPDHAAELTKIAQGLIARKGTYQQVSQTVWGDPQYWWYVAVTDQMEGGGGANTFLGNGQSLAHVTTEVPSGLGPFANFHDGAVVALRGLSAPKSIEQACYNLEGYNGWGYLSKPIEDPYLASFSNKYTKGKWVADHIYDANAISMQPGAITILKVLMPLDQTIQIPSDSQPEAIPVTTAATPLPVTATAPQIDMNALAALVAAQLRAPAPVAPVPATPALAPAGAASADPLTALASQLLAAFGASGAQQQITLASTVAHVNAFMPIIGAALAILPPPYNAIGTGIQLAQRAISAAVDVTTAIQTNPASVGTVLSSHMDVIGALTALLGKQFPAFKPFADAIGNAVPKIPAAPAAS